MNLAERLKRARLDAGLSLRKAGQLLQVSHNSVNDWETGKTQPDPNRYESIAAVYQANIEDLFKDEDGAPYMSAKNDIERELLRAVRSLPADTRRMAVGVVKGLKQSA